MNTCEKSESRDILTIMQKIDEINNSLDVLTRVINELEVRLGPIMGEGNRHSIIPSEDSKKPDRLLSELTNNLSNIHDTLNFQNNKISDIISQLDI